MSLRTIHIVFVVLCCALAVFVAAWAVTALEGSARWIWAVVSLAAGGLLVVYGRRFIEKTRDVA